MKFGLERIDAILTSLERPERTYPTAIVAGTNGKGSTAAILASILMRAGYRTGLYTSPHLIRVNERIQVDYREIPDEDFAWSFSKVRQAVERLVEEKRLDERPSFFEFLTATAFLHFARARVDFAVLEVGMGGRLDATNATEPRVAVITNIDLDHLEFLGSTHAAIAREKAGVIKPRKPVVSCCEHPEAAGVIRERCAELGADLLEISRFAKVSNVHAVRGQYAFDLRLNGDCFSDLVSPLLGRFQIANAVAAVAAARQLSREGFAVSRKAIVEGLTRAAWPGRLEVIWERPLVVVDGAHNPAGARAIAAFAKEHWAGKSLRLVFGCMRDKAIAEMSEILFPLAVEVWLTRPEQARAATPQEILAVAQGRPQNHVVEPDPARAIKGAYQASSSDDVVLVSGSLFLVGAIKQALLEGRLKLGG